MSEERFERFGWTAGIAFVVLELVGVAVGSAAGRATVTLADPASKIVKAFAEPVGTGVWVGAYMEIVSLAAFAVFAAWLFRSRAGVMRTAGLLGASCYIALSAISLIVGDVLEYGAGHAMPAQTLLALFHLQSGLFITTWGVAAGILIVAPATGWLQRSAFVIAGLSFVGMAFPKGAVGQVGALLFFVWVVAAALVLRREPQRARAPRPAVSAARPV